MENKLLYLILLGSIFFSCSTFYFTSPQPIDSKNLYEFPSQYRGTWVEGKDSMIVGKTFFRNIKNSERSIYKPEADTSSLLLMHDNKIYFIDSSNQIKLTGGFPYKVEGDSLFYIDHEVTEINLGPKAFLRKVEDKYILNIERESLWWELYLIQKNTDGSFMAKYLNKSDLEKIKNKKLLFSTEYDHYLEANWTVKELNAYIVKGIFSDTVIHLEPGNRVR